MNTVSVITVCFNSGSTLSHTLMSVSEQTYPKKEHIVIDGVSTDNTAAVLAQHRTALAVCLSEPDAGMYDAMNKGIHHATGEVIGFLNADDYYATPDALAQIMDAFQDPTVEAVYGDLQYVSPQCLTQVVRYWRSSPFKPSLFLTGWCPPHPTFYIRKSCLERFGGFDMQYRMGNDVEWMMRLLEVHRITTRYLPQVLVNMRTGGASNNKFSHIWLQNKEIIRAARQHQLPLSLFRFVFGKILNRVRQFYVRA